jgi:hypothetical protein
MVWHEFRNESTETIPPFGVLRVTGVVVPEPGRVVLLADRPDTFGCQDRGMLNGAVPVASGQYGVCTRTGPAAGLFEAADGVPVVGERWGPRPGGWRLRRHTGGFVIWGVTNASAGLALVQPWPMVSLLGKTDGLHGKNARATVSIWAGPLGAEVDTQHDLPLVYNRYGEVPAGKWVRCVWNDQGNDWELVAAEC